MRRPVSQTTASVSLFPFLAVLVCATGALIFLLLVTTRRVRMDAIAEAYAARIEASVDPTPPQPPEEPLEADAMAASVIDESASVQEDLDDAMTTPAETIVDAPIDPRPDWEARLAELEQERSRWRAELEKRKEATRKSNLELDTLKADLASVQKELKQLDEKQTADTTTLQSFGWKRDELERRLRDVKAAIAKHQEENTNAVSKYSILPYEGKSGTIRRPVYIECTNKSIRFLPEDIALTPQDLQGFSRRHNPLEAGAQALIDYWNARNRMQTDGNQPEPYVLLLVRPSGSVAFYLARKLLLPLGGRFGYELIEEDWELELPDADPQATQACREAIELVLAQRRQMLAVMSSGTERRGSTGRFNGSSQHIARPGSMFEYGNGTAGSSERGGGGTGHQATAGTDGNMHSLADGDAHASDSFDLDYLEAQSESSESVPSGRDVPSGPVKITDPRSVIASRGFFGSREFQKRSDVGAGGTGGRTTEDVHASGSTTSQAASTDPPAPSGSTHSADQFPLSNQAYPANPSDITADTMNAPRVALPPLTLSKNATANAVRQPAAAPARNSSHARHPAGAAGHRSSTSQSATRSGMPKQWGLPNPGATIGLERQVTIGVYKDGVVVGKDTVIPMDDDGLSDEYLERIVDAIDETAVNWGTPPREFYWSPAIRFVIQRGGESNHRWLNARFAKAGLSLSSIDAATLSRVSGEAN